MKTMKTGNIYCGTECPNCWGIETWEDTYQARAIDLDRVRQSLGQKQKTFVRRIADVLFFKPQKSE